jgi:hypothetical protein
VRWFLLWPPQYRVARGSARRQWKKLRLSKQQIAQMMEALPRQLASERWIAQCWPEPNPTAYLRDERWDDYVEPERRARARCEHQPPCSSPEWHLVMLSREKTS